MMMMVVMMIMMTMTMTVALRFTYATILAVSQSAHYDDDDDGGGGGCDDDGNDDDDDDGDLLMQPFWQLPKAHISRFSLLRLHRCYKHSWKYIILQFII